MKEKRLNFGFIGAGQIAHYSAKDVNAHEFGTVLAAQDLNAERLANLCSNESIPRSYHSAEALLADKDIDAVYIAVPNKFHSGLAIAALEAGKHVMLEKPFAMNYEEAVAVVETAERVGKKLTLGMNQRFIKGGLAVRSLVEAGNLGEVYHVKGSWIRRSGIPKLGTWFGTKALAGGGCLYDIGVHMLDLSLFAMNNFEPVSVTGVTYSKFGPRGLGEGSWGHSDKEDICFDVEDFASALIRMKNGASVTLDVTWACHTDEHNRNEVQVFGTEAGASCYQEKRYRYPKANEGTEYIVEDLPEVASPFSSNRFHNFINHILEDEPLCVKPAEALVVQKILDAIEQSCKTGQQVNL